MDISLRGVTNAVKNGEHELAHDITNVLEATGHESADLARKILNRLPGGMKIGNKILGRGQPRVPSSPFKPGEKGAPHPGDFPILTRDGESTCGNLQAWGGNEPFPLVGYKKLAAGAQTQGTDLVDFHASASNPTWITTDDLIPGNIEVYEATLAISPRLVTTGGFEGVGFLMSAWIIEYINGIEKARWSIKQLACMTGTFSILTSGASAALEKLDMPSIPWRRKYDPNVKAKTAMQIGVTTTTVSDLDCAFAEMGVRP